MGEELHAMDMEGSVILCEPSCSDAIEQMVRQGLGPMSNLSFREWVGACDLCGTSSFTTRDAIANILQCPGCGYRFVSPRPSQEEIEAAYSAPTFYDGWISDEVGRELMWRKRLAFVHKYAQPGVLLDVGAGIGSFLALARGCSNWDVTGTELSMRAIELARERHGISLLRGQLENVDLQPDSFDVITLWHVLEHVPSPVLTLRHCHSLLRAGGTLIVAVPNDDDASLFPGQAKRRVIGAFAGPCAVPVRYPRIELGQEIHLSYFTTRVLRRFLAASGLKLVTVTVDDHYPRPTQLSNLRVAVSRLLLRATGINFGEATLAVARKDA